MEREKSILTKVELEVKDLQEELSETEGDLTWKKLELKNQASLIEEGYQVSSKLKDRLNRQHNALVRLVEEVNKNEKVIEKLRLELMNGHELINKKEESIKEKKGQLKKKKQDITELKNDLSSQAKNMASKQESLLNTKKEIKATEKLGRELVSKKRSNSLKLKQTGDKISLMEKKLKEFTEGNEELTQDISELKKFFEKKNKEIKELRKREDEIHSHRMTLSQDKESLEKKVAKLKKDLHEERKVIQKLTFSYEQTEKKLVLLRQKREELEMESESIIESKNQIMVQNEAIETEFNSQTEEVESLYQENEKLKTETVQLTKTNEEKSKKLEELQETAKELQTQVEKNQNSCVIEREKAILLKHNISSEQENIEQMWLQKTEQEKFIQELDSSIEKLQKQQKLHEVWEKELSEGKESAATIIEEKKQILTHLQAQVRVTADTLEVEKQHYRELKQELDHLKAQEASLGKQAAKNRMNQDKVADDIRTTKKRISVTKAKIQKKQG